LYAPDTLNDGDSAVSVVRPWPSKPSLLEHLPQPTKESLAPVRSSILKHQEEHGRTYHSLSAGKYAYPNDDVEKDRLDLQHSTWLLSLRGKLALCPKAAGAKRVLDIGTGTGIWALDYADQHPESEVVGVDLSPIQPEWPLLISLE